VFGCGKELAWIYILAELLAALLACSIFGKQQMCFLFLCSRLLAYDAQQNVIKQLAALLACRNGFCSAHSVIAAVGKPAAGSVSHATLHSSSCMHNTPA
jgi:hypothetical protein